MPPKRPIRTRRRRRPSKTSTALAPRPIPRASDLPPPRPAPAAVVDGSRAYVQVPIDPQVVAAAGELVETITDAVEQARAFATLLRQFTTPKRRR